MKQILRTAIPVVASLGLIGVLAVSTSAPAADANAVPLASASTMLAATTAPMLVLDRAALEDQEDFSSSAFVAPPQPETSETPGITLAALVDAQATTDTVDAEQKCLAASVYFEAKGEPLSGQLAVAETVINRSRSGRFPTSLCGVIRQPGQFSFVRHGGRIPTPDTDSKAWRQAVAIARIAQADLWQDVAPNALYFHASRITNRAGGTKRIAQLGNHIFYR